jgi:hypothetical protein
MMKEHRKLKEGLILHQDIAMLELTSTSDRASRQRCSGLWSYLSKLALETAECTNRRWSVLLHSLWPEVGQTEIALAVLDSWWREWARYF